MVSRSKVERKNVVMTFVNLSDAKKAYCIEESGSRYKPRRRIHLL
jgi:hypothetical protein